MPELPIEMVCRLIDQRVASSTAACSKMIRHFQSHRGKMIRSKLLLLSAGACGEIHDNHLLAAGIIHLIHEATLFHDDVIDNGKMRRGVPTLNSRHGNKTAVLTGDLLLSHALKMSLGLGPKAVSIIADTILLTCEGEIEQDMSVFESPHSERNYLDIIRKKSAEIFGNSCYLGAFLTGSDEAICRRLYGYGVQLGMAYQISDDLADITGSDVQLGKTAGLDMVGGIMTLPIIHYRQQGGDLELLSSISQNKKAELLTESGSFIYCKNMIEAFCRQADEQLRPLEKNPYKVALQVAAESIMSKAADLSGT